MIDEQTRIGLVYGGIVLTAIILGILAIGWWLS